MRRFLVLRVPLIMTEVIPMIELQDIFKRFGAEYQSTHSLSIDQQKAVNAILRCRTSSLGGHIDVCDSCGSYRISYNSCRNRNCPKCGNLKKEQWILDRKAEILPIPYFHTVFTVPDDLNPLFRSNEALMHSLLFKAASQTLSALTLDKKYLGAQIGVIMVLHTWGQNLCFHPHVHCIVPGGGLSPSGLSFIQSRKKFFIPVKVLSRVFRGKFLALLKQSFLAGDIIFYGNSSQNTKDSFYDVVDSLYKKEWVVYCKKPFKQSTDIVEYLSRYTHKTAVYNNRLISMDDSTVSFKWRDYRDGNKVKIMSLDAMEFIRRFLMHVLPSGFQKIRYYGLLSNRNRTSKLITCFKLLKTPILKRVRLTAHELLLKVKGVDITVCPHCGDHWILHRSLLPPSLSG